MNERVRFVLEIEVNQENHSIEVEMRRRTAKDYYGSNLPSLKMTLDSSEDLLVNLHAVNSSIDIYRSYIHEALAQTVKETKTDEENNRVDDLM